MQKFQVNIDALKTKLTKKAYRLADVKDRIEIVGFDIVRFSDGDEASKLWQIQTADDGDYIVTLYDEAPEVKNAKWEVTLSKTAQALNFYYKGEPIVKVAVARLGIPAEEVCSAERYLPAKLAEDKKLVSALLDELNEAAKNAVLSKYPELL